MSCLPLAYSVASIDIHRFVCASSSTNVRGVQIFEFAKTY